MGFFDFLGGIFGGNKQQEAVPDFMKNMQDEEYITLNSANGEDIEFTIIAGIVLKGKYYAILQPVELLEGMDDDEALVFHVTATPNGDSFEIELNDRIVDAVFREYDKLLQQQ